MKEVIKVSIGSWAFTLDTSAYDFLQAYLDALKTQAQDVAAVEESLGKYLSSQVKNVSQVVTMQQIQQAIQDLGLPAFDAFSSNAEHQTSDENAKNKVDDFTQEFSQRLQEKMHKHRLYRHPEQKVLGGVFGGWAAYLGWDASVLRILYSVFLLVFLFAESRVFPILLLVYVAMWVAMPLARNQQQLNQLYGVGAEKTANRAQHRGNEVVNDMAQELRQSQLGRFLSEFFRIAFGIIFFLVGMTGLVILPLCFIWLLPAELINFFDFMPMMPALGVSKVLFYICLFIPFLIFFYEGIKLLFNLRFKKFRLGGLLLLFWLVAMIAMAFSTAAGIGHIGKSHVETTQNYPIEQQQDTLYISIDERAFSDQTYVCVIGESLYFLWDDPDEKATLYSMPVLKIHNDGLHNEISIKTTYASCLLNANFDFLLDDRKMIEKEGKNLKIYPRAYNKERPWNLSLCKMDIYVPAHTIVVMDYADNSKDCVLKSNKRYFPYRGYTQDIDDDVDISSIDGRRLSSFDFCWD